MNNAVNNNNRANNMPWYMLEGPGAAQFNTEFASRIYGDEMPTFFRSHNFENTLLKARLNCNAMQVSVLSFQKTSGLFGKPEGVVGYLNDSMGLGYGPGTHFLTTTTALINEYCRVRHLQVTVEKEGVSLIIEVTGGKLPESFASDIKALIYANKEKYNFRNGRNFTNVLDLLGSHKMHVGHAATMIEPDPSIPINLIKEAVREMFEDTKMSHRTGEISFDELLIRAKATKGTLPIKTIFNSLDQAAIEGEYYRNKSLFEVSLSLLPDEYMDVLEEKLAKKEISRSTYEYLKMVNTRFIDVKFSTFDPVTGALRNMVLNEAGVHLMMSRTMKHPEFARSAIGIAGADELSGQLVIKGSGAYNFSLDINNLSGINREFGMAMGDKFISVHTEAFQTVVERVRNGEIKTAEAAIVEYYRLMNETVVTVDLGRVTPEQLAKLKKNGAVVNGEGVSVRLGNLERVYLKNPKISHKGVSGTIVLTNISTQERRELAHIEHMLRNEVKELKKKAGKDGSLLVEIRDYGKDDRGNTTVRSTLLTLREGKEIGRKMEMKILERTKAQMQALPEGLYDEMKSKYGEEFARVMRRSIKGLNDEKLASIDFQLAKGIKSMSAVQLAQELGISRTKAANIIAAAKTSITRQAGGQFLSLIIGLAGMEAASKLLDRLIPDMNPTLQFGAVIFVGHNMNNMGKVVFESVRTGKLTSLTKINKLLDLKGGLRAMNPMTMGNGLVASAVWNLTMELTGIDPTSTVGTTGSIVSFVTPDAYKITAGFLGAKYGWKLLPNGAFATGAAKAAGVFAVTNFAVGLIGGGEQSLFLDPYERSILTRTSDLYVQTYGGWKSPTMWAKKTTDLFGAKSYTDIFIALQAGQQYVDMVTEQDEQFATGISTGLRTFFGTTMYSQLNHGTVKDLKGLSLTPENMAVARMIIKAAVADLVRDKESKKQFNEWKGFISLYSSSNYIDIPSGLMTLDVNHPEKFEPSDSFVMWVVNKGIV